jgi:hypothetical protein
MDLGAALRRMTTSTGTVCDDAPAPSVRTIRAADTPMA